MLLHGTHESLRVTSMLDKPPAQVATLQVRVWIERMDHPELVARATYRHIIALLEAVLRPGIAILEPTVVGRAVHHGEEDDIPFISLELSSIATKKPMFRNDIRREPTPEKTFNE